MVTIMRPSRPRVRERGAGGSCAGKSEAIRVLHSIWRGHGPVTGQTRAVPRSAPSWCGAITSGKLSARKTVSGSFKAATTATPYGPGPDPSQAPSHSGAPEAGRPVRVGVLSPTQGRSRRDVRAGSQTRKAARGRLFCYGRVRRAIEVFNSPSVTSLTLVARGLSYQRSSRPHPGSCLEIANGYFSKSALARVSGKSG